MSNVPIAGLWDAPFADILRSSTVALAREVREHCSQGAGKELPEIKPPVPSLA